MIYETKSTVAIYVDRARRQWVVRDGEGNFWLLPSTDHSWEDREPFHPTEETELEPIPKHYRSMLDLPF
jgi:hypothetical protein